MMVGRSISNPESKSPRRAGWSRRAFLANSLAGTAAVFAAGGSPLVRSAPGAQQTRIAGASKVKLGYDNFAVRALGWKAEQLIEYGQTLKIDSLFISDLDSLGGLETPRLAAIRQRAARAGMQLHVGTWSICPTSKSFRDKWGSAEEHLRLGIRVAKDLGSPVLRVILGNGEDRTTPGGIQARIVDTVQVCRACRAVAIDAGVKIAVENHAGDLQARELVQLIQQAGEDYVGANLDSGNATWTLEDPLTNLELLGPHVLTTSLRDSAVWESEQGATVQWTAMGDGNVDLQTYFRRFVELCPGVPVHIETISGFNREIPYLKPDYWAGFPDARASEFARYLALAKTGKPRTAWVAPPDKDRKVAEQEYQKSEVERSLNYCRETLGFGAKTM